MAKKSEVITTQNPDGKFTKQATNQIIVMLVFFNHDSEETFEDKLLRVILAEEEVFCNHGT